mgnify:CR=1 FL=1
MRIGYTKKQAALLRLFAEGKLHRYTILSGSVRSGKTWISLVIWAFWVATRPKGGVYMMAGYGIGFTVFMLITLAVFAAVTFVLYRWLRKKGCEIFATL